MKERERLARIFEIEPMRPVGALVMAGLMAVIPWPLTWIGSGTIVLWLTAIYTDEQRKIREGLAEVDAWGFKVNGYREWLLAREPAFDLELRRDVGIDLIAASVAAVDSTITVELRGERVVRVVMLPVEVRGGPEVELFFAGDRKRLRELCDRVLAPLHADVGIAEMRMGDREALGALVARPAKDRETAFRDQGKVAPPDLQSLARAGTSQRRPPREANVLKLRVDRLLYATGQHPASAGAMTASVGVLAVVGMIIAPIGAVIGVAAGSGIAWSMLRSDRNKVERALAQATRYPFPVEHYDDWLLSGRPILDIEFGSPPRRAELERALRGVARVADLTWLDDTLVRMESQPVMHICGPGIPSFWGGDPRELQQVSRRVLVPLHDTHRVVAVRMGGYLDRRG
ncbi:MAG TPA: hypothetical protein VIV11_03280 [Kofleriaceae bacterium]